MLVISDVPRAAFSDVLYMHVALQRSARVGDLHTLQAIENEGITSKRQANILTSTLGWSLILLNRTSPVLRACPPTPLR